MVWRHVTLGADDEDTSPDREARKKPTLSWQARPAVFRRVACAGNGTWFAEIRGMAKPNRNPTANGPRTQTEQPRADRTSPTGEQGASERPDEEIEVAQDDDDEFGDADEVDEDDEDAEDEDEAEERH